MDTKNKQDIEHRLAVALGHLQRVRVMVEKEVYCIDILQQSLAVQAALKRVDEKILENHLKTCVANSMRKGQTESAVNEVIDVFRKGRK